jgi:rubrerythrin
MPAQELTIKEIISKAIDFEQDAYEFYTDAIEMVKHQHIKDALKDLADQEVEHKTKLQKLRDGDLDTAVPATGKKIQDLKLAEYLIPPTLDENATFQDILLVAMHREKSSFDFYTQMAHLTQDEATKKLFEFLAQEELAHKNKVETIYDEGIYQDF